RGTGRPATGFRLWRCMPVPRPFPRRIATVSVHTSPLEQPGTGDAGGLNVYVVEVARRLAARGVEVDVFTRAVSRDLPPVAELAPGVLVRHLPAGPFDDLDKAENAALAAGDAAEPAVRLRGEAEVIAAADQLVANTDEEARQLIELYDA